MYFEEEDDDRGFFLTIFMNHDLIPRYFGKKLLFHILENDRVLFCPGGCYLKVRDVLKSKRSGIDMCYQYVS